MGRTEEGGRAASSHTANLVGVDALYEAAFHEANVIRCTDIEQMADVAQLLEPPIRIPRKRLGIMSFSGGLGVLATDLAVANGLEVPAFTQHTSDTLKAVVPFAATNNPVDPTAQGLNDLSVFEKMCEVMLSDDNVDVFLINAGYSLMPDSRGPVIAEAITRATRASAAQTVVVGMAHHDAAARLHEAHIPLYATLRAATEALGALARHQAGQDRGPSADELAAVSQDPVQPPMRSGEQESAVQLLLESPGPDEAKAKQFLRAWGIPVPEGSVVADSREALAAVERLGYPAVVKAVGPGVTHKSEHGLVRLGVSSSQEFQQACEGVLSNSRQLADPVGGLLIERMDAEPAVAELIVTCSVDASFGSYIMIGMGGVLTELLHDTAVLLPPFTDEQVRTALQSLRAYPLLRGFRGAAPADVDAVVELVRRLGAATRDLALRGVELELNPVAVHAQSKGVMVLDALVSSRTS